MSHFYTNSCTLCEYEVNIILHMVFLSKGSESNYTFSFCGRYVKHLVYLKLPSNSRDNIRKCAIYDACIVLLVSSLMLW